MFKLPATNMRVIIYRTCVNHYHSLLHTPLLHLHSLTPVLPEIPIITKRITNHARPHKHSTLLARATVRRTIPRQSPLHLEVVGFVACRTYWAMLAGVIHQEVWRLAVGGWKVGDGGREETHDTHGDMRNNLDQAYGGCRGPRRRHRRW